MNNEWLVVAAWATMAVPIAVRWRRLGPAARLLHAAGGFLLGFAVAAQANFLLEELVISGGPILPAGMAWLLVSVSLFVMAVGIAAAWLPWRGHVPWALLSPLLFVTLMEATYHTDYRIGDGDARVVLQAIVFMAGSAAAPWALAGAVQRWGRWDGKLQTGFVALATLALALPGVYAGLGGYDTEPALHSITIEVNATGPYELVLTLPWTSSGPWQLFLEDSIGDFAAATNLEWNQQSGGRLHLEGSGNGTLVFSITFYGHTGLQEESLRGDVKLETTDDVLLSVTADARAPYCHFVNTWHGGNGTLTPGDGYGECE